MELAYRLVPISQGPKNSGIPGPNTLPLPHVMHIITHPKHYARGCINHRCINSYKPIKTSIYRKKYVNGSEHSKGYKKTGAALILA
jgi:hypothetical protein